MNEPTNPDLAAKEAELMKLCEAGEQHVKKYISMLARLRAESVALCEAYGEAGFHAAKRTHARAEETLAELRLILAMKDKQPS